MPETLMPDSGVPCAGCGQPAPHTDKATGRRYCADCLFQPVPFYGPGYQWGHSRLRSQSSCGHLSPRPWQHHCTMARGHDGLHEGWGGDNGTSGDPLTAWDSDGRLWYVNEMWVNGPAGWLTPGTG